VGLDEYQLERLIKVPASEAIGGESTHFTPWLATHIDLLAESLGIGLTVGEDRDAARIIAQHTEIPVGMFSLDIQCSTADGRTVAIENQYGRSNHSHLGQVITYASGIDADVVVWISEAFAEPHLEALRWLNRRTDSECGVFAVEIAFFKIGESGPAPKLTTLIEPSEWQRDSRRATLIAHNWTSDEFLDSIEDLGDRASAKRLFDRAENGGGRIWWGRRPIGYVILHPIAAQYGTLGLWINNNGQVQVRGLWTHWPNIKNHPAYEDVAAAFGLSAAGPAASAPLAQFDVDDLWSAALASAQKLKLASDQELATDAIS
jgi:hypothetical protein